MGAAGTEGAEGFASGNSRLGPRLVVAGTHSGSGKTTVATGLMAALSRRGMTVSSGKVGPDFIDPGYHHLATGRTGRNLDEWICGSESIAPLAARAAAGSDILIVEGVMGLFDGASTAGPQASTASVARLIDAPILLVVDASSIGRSVAAMVDGYLRLAESEGARIRAVVLNKVGSDNHEAILRAALDPTGVPVLGSLPRDERLSWRDRHLGLVPVVERPAEVARSLEVLAAAVSERVDLDSVVRLARSAPPLSPAGLPPTRTTGRCRIAVVTGKAFSFAYADNMERLAEAGAELLPLDPLSDQLLPEGCTALYAGGGFPETYAAELSANLPLRLAVSKAWAGGLVVWAECGGLAWLSRSLDEHQMCGVVPTSVRMTGHLTLGYRSGSCDRESPVAPAGAVLRGHEFHYSVCTPAGSALTLSGRTGTTTHGFAGPRLMASYLHQHLGADPVPAELLVALASTPVA